MHRSAQEHLITSTSRKTALGMTEYGTIQACTAQAWMRCQPLWREQTNSIPGEPQLLLSSCLNRALSAGRMITLPLSQQEGLFNAQSRLHPGVRPHSPLAPSAPASAVRPYRAPTPPFGGWPSAVDWPITAKATAAAARVVQEAAERAESVLRGAPPPQHGGPPKRFSIAPHEHTFGTNDIYDRGRRLRRLDKFSLHQGNTATRIAVSDTFRRSHSCPPGYKAVRLNHPY